MTHLELQLCWGCWGNNELYLVKWGERKLLNLYELSQVQQNSFWNKIHVSGLSANIPYFYCGEKKEILQRDHQLKTTALAQLQSNNLTLQVELKYMFLYDLDTPKNVGTFSHSCGYGFTGFAVFRTKSEWELKWNWELLVHGI